MIYDHLWVAGAHDTVLDSADLFTITLRNDDIQEFHTRWDEILLSMIKIPLDDFLESLYKLWEIHQKIPKPVYQKMKTTVRRSTDQKLRLRNFDARNERIETGAVVTNHRGRRGVERGQGVCYQWKAKGQRSRSDKCSFRHDGDERAKPTPKTGPPSESPTQRGRSASSSLNSHARSTPKVFAQNYLVAIGILPNCNSLSLDRVVNSAISAR